MNFGKFRGIALMRSHPTALLPKRADETGCKRMISLRMKNPRRTRHAVQRCARRLPGRDSLLFAQKTSCPAIHALRRS